MDRSFFLIGISGASGSGKTTLAQEIANEFIDKSLVISEDDYYKDFAHMPNFNAQNYNFDNPDARDVTLLLNHLSLLKNGQGVEKPIYDFANHKRSNEIQYIEAKPLIIIEGIHCLCHQELRALFDLSIFVDTDFEICFARRLKRDIEERDRTKESVYKAFEDFVRPSFYEFTYPCREFANIKITMNENEDLQYQKTRKRISDIICKNILF